MSGPMKLTLHQLYKMEGDNTVIISFQHGRVRKVLFITAYVIVGDGSDNKYKNCVR